MLHSAIQDARIKQVEIAERLGIRSSTVSMKLAGHRPWRPPEMAAVRELLRERTGREYTVDELFFSEAGAA